MDTIPHSRSRGPTASARGVTLIELVVSIAVIAIAVTAVLGAFSGAATRSADTLISQQCIAVASAYLNEVLSKPYTDPDGADGEANRASFDDVDDYNGLVDNGARDQLGNAIAGLNLLQVTVAVGGGTLGSVPAADVRRVDVTVRGPSGRLVQLSGYRTRY